MKELTKDILKELLHYDPDSGIFKWRNRDIKWFSNCKDPQRQCKLWNARFSKKIAGTLYTDDFGLTYVRISVNNSGPHLAHRLAYLYVTGSLPIKEIDHIDGDGTNNKFNNLRSVSSIENLKNKTIQSNNRSGFNGVSWNKKLKKWHVYVNANKCRINGGYFINLNDAIEKRRQLNLEYGFHKNHGRIKNKNVCCRH